MVSSAAAAPLGRQVAVQPRGGVAGHARVPAGSRRCHPGHRARPQLFQGAWAHGCCSRGAWATKRRTRCLLEGPRTRPKLQASPGGGSTPNSPCTRTAARARGWSCLAFWPRARTGMQSAGPTRASHTRAQQAHHKQGYATATLCRWRPLSPPLPPRLSLPQTRC